MPACGKGAWSDLPEDMKRALLYGNAGDAKRKKKSEPYEGIIPRLERMLETGEAESDGDDEVQDGAIGPEGLARTYQTLFGDPWEASLEVLPGSLRQPEMRLPFRSGQVWAYTGGPHTGWGTGEPFSAIDFAPGAEESGCVTAGQDQYAVAMADGLVVRSDIDGTIIDLDKDGDERTGWVLFYLHLATSGRVPAGVTVKAGDVVGYPSCEGGRVTGTHVHIARKYNGEWISSDGDIPFNLDGWISSGNGIEYDGYLTRGSTVLEALEGVFEGQNQISR